MQSDRKSYLRVENLNVSYKNNHVLEDISFQIERGHFVCAIGRQMLLLSGAFGLLAGAQGIAASAQLNLPTGPTIVLANVALLIFAMSLLGRGKLIRPATSQLDRV
jgi:ATPase subunit of ABC transporter with duplicated ATPase domains